MLLLHHEVERIQELLNLPGWAWVGLGAAAVFVSPACMKAPSHLADHYFNRPVERAEQKLGQAIRSAKTPPEIDKLLADKTHEALSSPRPRRPRERTGLRAQRQRQGLESRHGNEDQGS